MIRNAASERQVQSANPQASTWLSANAGSGKTRVLTDRVARMLLAGVDPGRILCLTYTKAAASEMQNRLFARLGDWAMKEDAALRKALAELGVDGAVDGARLARARQLFARAIETPGGLRIQTIHSFCASLLRRFPLEARVSPQFTEMDDRAAALLRDEIIDELADRGAPEVIGALAGAYTGEDFGSLAAEVAGRRNDFKTFLTDAQCRALFGVPDNQTEDAILEQVFLGGEAALLAEVAGILATGSANDVKAAAKLVDVPLNVPDFRSQVGLEGCLLFQSSKLAGKSFTAKIDAVATKATAPKLEHLADRLNALALRVEAARGARIALTAAKRTAILHRFAAAFLPKYKARKEAHGWLDFDDLITSAKALLTEALFARYDAPPRRFELLGRLRFFIKETAGKEDARARVCLMWVGVVGIAASVQPSCLITLFSNPILFQTTTREHVKSHLSLPPLARASSPLVPCHHLLLTFRSVSCFFRSNATTTQTFQDRLSRLRCRSSRALRTSATMPPRARPSLLWPAPFWRALPPRPPRPPGRPCCIR